jgi:SAM-dependent methyltransferase
MTALEESVAAARASLYGSDFPVPRDEDIFVGDGDFREISLEFLEYFISVGKLSPEANVLDIGCGIGRMAAGLAHYLDPERGQYIGLDPVPGGIEWCAENISPIAPNFSFHWFNVFNELYNPHGTLDSTNASLPIDRRQVDLVIATSVFTHLYEEEILNYAREIARVLREGGKAICTAYVFDGPVPPSNVTAEHLQFADVPMLNKHSHHVGGLPPLAAVAYPEQYLLDLVKSASGCKVECYSGRWRGGAGPWFQDMLVFEAVSP